MKNTVLVFILLLWVIVGCADTPRNIPKFKRGDIVYLILSEQKGIIVDIDPGHVGCIDLYQVKLPPTLKGTANLAFGFGGGEFGYECQTFWVKEYEIKNTGGIK